MTVKSNTRNLKNQGPKPTGKQNSNQKSKESSRPKANAPLVAAPESSISGSSLTGDIGVQDLVVLDTKAAPSSNPVSTMPTVAATLSRPVAGRQLNDSRIPSLEDHIRIVQMMHVGERNLKKAAKDLACRLNVSRKEALAALQACS
jgi:hypothetical protein